ncbi:MAG: hypothetical protein EOP05_19870 [Proteobacteria bacterium]|nr:MAG: hypothetical protein EOP05_19870 [Pseudomonadota bacterium]
MNVFIILATVFFSFAAHAEAPSCSALKSALFSKSTIEIRMVFGYKDARPARFVGDRHERLAFIEKIMTPCEVGNQACGFTRSKEDADLFTKPVFIEGRPKTVRLMVVNSSVGSDDEENLSDPFQEWKSKHAQKTFLSGLREADVVFYNGHSRFGGGPDFGSPQLAKDGTIDASIYKSKKRGLTKLLNALEESQRPKSPRYAGLKVLGLYSCTSSQHFNNRIRSSSDAALISSNVLMYYSDALDQSLSAMSTLLREQCPKSLIL